MLKPRTFVTLILFVTAVFHWAARAAEGNPKASLLPLVFERNMGQVPSSYSFLSRRGNVQSLFSGRGAEIVVGHEGASARIAFRIIGARSDVEPVGRAPLPSVTNYLIGNDPSRWIKGIPNVGQVLYSDIYPGIDLMFHGKGDQLEHDFRIGVGANPELVRFAIDGGNRMVLDSSGNLEISIANGKLLFQKPRAFQETPNGSKDVSADFVLNSDSSVQFKLGSYDPGRELVIDPVFSFSTYLAGSSADYSAAVATDSVGNVYVTGYTVSPDFPIVNGLQKTISGSPDAFVSEFDPTGRTLLYSTYLGGSSRNYGNAIAVDPSGNIIVTGTSSSNDFPHVGSVPPLTCEGNNDCFFIASLKPDGSAFNYAGLIGGIEGTDVQTGGSGSGVLGLDVSGNAYLAGVTDDANFEITPGTLSNTVPGYPYNSTFVLEVNRQGALAYSTIVPGIAPQNLGIYLNNVFIPNGISVDANGEATIAGTAGPGLPATAGVIQPTFPNGNSGNSSAGFILQLNAAASAIKYATYITGTDLVGGLAVNGSGDVYMTGGTSESNLPVSSNAYQKTLKSGQNCTCNSGFIVELNSNGSAVLAATYLEGTPASGNEGTNFTGIALDSNSNVFVGGMTASTDFPLQNPFTSEWVYGQSVSDMVLAEMSPDLSALLFGSFLSSTDQIFPASQFSALSVDHQNDLVVFGQTSTTDFPTTPGSFQPTPPTQAYHTFIAKLNMSTPAPSFCPSSWSLSFGNVTAKKSSTQILNLTNCGNSVFHLNSVVSSAATITVKDSCATIKAGAKCPVSVTFSPVDSSLTSGTLTFNDDAVISPQSIAVSGQGIAPQLSPSSGSYSFGHLLVKTTGVSNGLFFSNAGNAPLNISSASVDGDFSITQNYCQGTLQPGGFCDIEIVFSPTASGVRTGTLTIVSNDPLHPHAGISLNGIGDTAYANPVMTSLGLPTVQINNGAIIVQVYGANFYPASVVQVNGKPQATTYYSGGQLEATLDSTFTRAIGEISVTVSNPTPGGGNSVGVPLTRYAVLNVDAAFLTTVPGSTLLYASIPSSAPANPNTVISINPVTGAVGTPIPVGQNPWLLAPSSDGSYLFVVANQDQTVQRINLSTGTVDRTFPFPPNGTDCCGALSGTDLKGIPGTPQEVVLATDIPLYGFGEMALYNDSGMVNYVPTSAQGTLSFSSFAYAGNPLTIYSLPFTEAQNPFFNVVNIGAQGLEYTVPQCCYGINNTTGAQVVSDGSLLYTSAGEVWNPASQAQVGSFPVTTYNDTSYPNLFNLLLDTPTSHIFVIGDQNYLADSSAITLSAYGQQSLALTGALAFPQLSQPIVQSLVRWGTNGFAFIGQGSTPDVQAVFSLTSSLAKSVTSNPVPVLRSLTPLSASQGSPDLQLTLNGQGFVESSSVLWNGSPLQTTYDASTVLTALVPAANLVNSGTASIVVSNPPPGGGKSGVAHFTIAPLTPLISFSSSTVTFPAQKVGTSSAAQTVAVQNPGTAPLNISTIKITGLDASSFHQANNCGTTLAPGANCALSIVFKPTAVGSLNAAVSFTDNAAGSPQKITLSGTGD